MLLVTGEWGCFYLAHKELMTVFSEKGNLMWSARASENYAGELKGPPIPRSGPTTQYVPSEAFNVGNAYNLGKSYS